MQFDTTLNEICKISIMKSIASLSRFLQRPIGIDIEAITIKPIIDMDLFRQDYTVRANTFTPIKGDVSGVILLNYPRQSALEICDLVLNKPQGQTSNFYEIEISALLEIANVCVGNFLSAFSDALQLQALNHQISIFDCNLPSVINEQVFNYFPDYFDDYIKMNLTFKLNSAKGNLIVLLNYREVNVFLENILNRTYFKALQQ